MVRGGSLGPIILVGAVFALALVIGGNFFGIIEFTFSTAQHPFIGPNAPIGSRVLIGETALDGGRCKNTGLQGSIGAIDTFNSVDYYVIVFDPPGQFEPYQPERASYLVAGRCVLVIGA